jgi:large subunit ribosomal protein L2
MKAEDLITTTWKIPTIPVKPVEGNSYPLGALPVGTEVCLVQWYPDSSEINVYNEEDSAKIVRKLGNRVIIQRQTKLQFSLDERCQCVVGQISIHPLKACHIGIVQC